MFSRRGKNWSQAESGVGIKAAGTHVSSTGGCLLTIMLWTKFIFCLSSNTITGWLCLYLVLFGDHRLALPDAAALRGLLLLNRKPRLCTQPVSQ